MTSEDRLKYIIYSGKISKTVAASQMSLTDCSTIIVCLEQMLKLVTGDNEDE